MLSTLRPFFLLFLSGSLLMTGYGLSNLLLPLRLRFDEVPVDQIGLILACTSFGFLVGAKLSESLMSNWGHIRVTALCGGFTSAAIIMCGLYPDPIIIAAMRFIMGLSVALLNAVLDSWLSNSASTENRGRLLAVNQVVLMSALCLGQLLINFAPVSGHELFMLCALLFSLSIVPVLLSKNTQPEVDVSDSLSLFEVVKASPLGSFSPLLCGLSYGGLISMLPIYLDDIHVSPSELSQLMGAALAGGMIMQLPMGILADRFGRRVVIAAVGLVMFTASSFAPSLLDHHNYVMGGVLLGLICGLTVCLYPLGIAETFDNIQQSQLLAAMGALLTIYGTGSIFGPYLASVFMKLNGASGLFLYIEICSLCIIIFTFFQIFKRAPMPLEDQENMVWMAPSALVTHLDPRVDFSPSVVLDERGVAAVELAQANPNIAVRIARKIVESDPLQGERLAIELAKEDHISVIRMYEAMCSSVPDTSNSLALALASDNVENAEAMVSWMAEHEPDQVAALLIAIQGLFPQEHSDLVKAAAEIIDGNDDQTVIDLASQVASEYVDTVNDMRAIDRAVIDDSNMAADLFQGMSDAVPEQSVNIATAMVEEAPDVAVELTEALVDVLSADDHTKEETGHEIMEFVESVGESAPAQLLDVGVTVVETHPELASELVEVMQENLNKMSDDINDKPSV